jgi:hypothetical protein
MDCSERALPTDPTLQRHQLALFEPVKPEAGKA